MEALRVDFSMQRGHEMLISREPDLLRDELDEIDIAMLQTHQAPRLLMMDWMEMDGKVTFRYSIAGRKMVSQRLQIQSLKMSEYYALILGVVEVLDECKPYMLREEGFLLHENYLFVGADWGDIRAAYMPLRESASGKPAREALLALAVRWVAYVQEVDGTGLQKVLHHLENGGSWQTIRNELLVLLSGNPSVRSEAKKLSAGEPRYLDREEKEPVSPVDRWQIGSKSEYPLLALAEEEDADFLDEVEPAGLMPADPQASRARWLSGAAALVAAAAVWKLVYLSDPSQKHLLLSAAVTAAAAGALFFYWRKLSSSTNERYEEGNDPEHFDNWNDSEPEFDRKDEKQAGFKHDEDSDILGAAMAVGVGEQSAAVPTHDSTAALIKGRDETVALQPSGGSRHSQDGGCWLEREWKGESRRVELQKGTTVIGRSDEAADYIDEADGVSRAHLEIIQQPGSVRVRDLGSRNGSLLGEQAMIPYKYYELQEGDIVHVAGAAGPAYILKGCR